VAPSVEVDRPADLVILDAGTSWTVTGDALLSRGKNNPLLGRELPGQVLLTVARGRVAHIGA
jgi:dihydroorotase